MQKVAVIMNKFETVNNVFENVGGIAKTSDFVSAGLSNFDVAELCNQGYIERIRRGFYKLNDSENSILSEECILSNFLPQSVVCVESALLYYDYSDYTPQKWNVAVSRSSVRAVKAMGDFPLKPYYVQDEFLHYGETTGDFNGTVLPVYDRERTVCDCFKYRKRIGTEVFVKAVKRYAQDENKSIMNLSDYAKDMKLYEKVMNIMEVLLND